MHLSGDFILKSALWNGQKAIWIDGERFTSMKQLYIIAMLPKAQICTSCMLLRMMTLLNVMSFLRELSLKKTGIKTQKNSKIFYNYLHKFFISFSIF